MGQRAWWIVLLALLCAVGAWFAMGEGLRAPVEGAGGGEADTGNPSPGAARGTDALPEGVALDRGVGRVEATEDELLGPATWVVRGTVYRGSPRARPRVPHPGSLIRLERFAGAGTDGELLETVDLAADAHGGFQWSLPPADVLVTLRVSSREERARSEATTQWFTAGEAPPDRLDLWVYPYDATIRGRVTDMGGVPLRDARVVATSVADGVMTDAAGNYVIPVSSSAPRTYLRAAALGFGIKRLDLQALEVGETRIADFALAPGWKIFGTVVDAQRRPMAGVEVVTFRTSFFDKQVTGADGTFSLDYLSMGSKDQLLIAKHPGYADFSDWVNQIGAAKAQVVVLRSGARVQGRVFGVDGQPVAGARLYMGFHPAAFDRLDAVAGDDGGFVFPNVGAGTHTMVTRAHGAADDQRTVDVSDAEPVVTVDVQLLPGRILAGTVFDDAGRPLPQVVVQARTPQVESSQRELMGEFQTTDVAGKFRLQGLSGSSVFLTVRGPGVHSDTVGPFDLGREDVRVVMQRSAGLAGTVVDAETGRPVEEFRIRFLDGGHGISEVWIKEGHHVSSPEGRWTTGDRSLKNDAKLTVAILAPGYGREVRDMVTALNPDPTATVFRLRRGGRVSGRVVAVDSGRPIAGAVVTHFDAEQPMDFADDLLGRTVATTDAAGWFELQDLPIAVTHLSVAHDGWAVQTDGPFPVEVDRPVERTIVLLERR